MSIPGDVDWVSTSAPRWKQLGGDFDGDGLEIMDQGAVFTGTKSTCFGSMGMI